MLNLLTHYQRTLENPSSLNAIIDLVSTTSQLISIFKDQEPVKMEDDPRLIQLEKILKWFDDWEEEHKSDGRQPHEIFSPELLVDLRCTVNAFLYICRQQISMDRCVIPAILNSDGIVNQPHTDIKTMTPEVCGHGSAVQSDREVSPATVTSDMSSHGHAEESDTGMRKVTQKDSSKGSAKRPYKKLSKATLKVMDHERSDKKVSKVIPKVLDHGRSYKKMSKVTPKVQDHERSYKKVSKITPKVLDHCSTTAYSIVKTVIPPDVPKSQGHAANMPEKRYILTDEPVVPGKKPCKVVYPADIWGL